MSENDTCEGTYIIIFLSHFESYPHAIICTDIDECGMSMFNCIPEAMCVNTIGSYVCTCSDGYCGNGTVCEGELV